MFILAITIFLLAHKHLFAIIVLGDILIVGTHLFCAAFWGYRMVVIIMWKGINYVRFDSVLRCFIVINYCNKTLVKEEVPTQLRVGTSLHI